MTYLGLRSSNVRLFASGGDFGRNGEKMVLRWFSVEVEGGVC